MSKLINVSSRVTPPSLAPVVRDEDLKQTVNALVEAMIPLVGQHSNRKEAAIRWSDLEASGFGVSFNGDGLLVDDPNLDIPQMPTVPAIPRGVHVEATFKTVMVFFDPAGYTGHSLAEIWRAPAFKGPDGDIPTTRADAIFAGSTTTIAWSQTALPLDKWRYWVRFVNVKGVAGPFDSEEGHAIEVPASPSYLIDKISGEIKQSDLYKALGEKIQGSHDGVVSHQEILDRSYTFRIDTGGAVHGFGLAVDENNHSLFLIRTDRFALAPPQQYDVDGKPILDPNSLPFIVDMTDPAHPKCLLRNAYIDKAFIEEVVAGKITADYINALELNAVKIRGGTIQIGNDFSVDASGMMTALNANMRGVFQSANFVSGVQGYRLLQNGVAEFQNGIFRGTIYAMDGEFHGTLYAERIVGDVMTERDFDTARSVITDNSDFPQPTWVTVGTFSIVNARSYVRKLRLVGEPMYGGGSTYGSASGGVLYAHAFAPPGGSIFSNSARLRIQYDGAVVFDKTITATAQGGMGSAESTVSWELDALLTVPAYTNGQIVIETLMMGANQGVGGGALGWLGGVVTARLFKYSEEIV